MVQISFTIPDGNLQELKDGFFKVFPVPSGSSDLDWFKQVIREHVIRIYRKGKTIIAQETTEPSYISGSGVIQDA